MRSTQFVISLTSIQNKTYKSLETLAYNLDNKQWTSAGIEIGRLEEMASAMVEVCRLAKDALWEDSVA